LNEKISNFKAKFNHSNDTQRKMFTHLPLPVIELNAEIIDDRRYYTTPSGIKYPSVTTVLGGMSKPHIDAWKLRVGEDEAKKVLVQSSHRGTVVHDIAEKYMRNAQDYTKGHFPFDTQSFAQIRPFLDAHVDNIRGIEYPLWSDRLHTAGRTDIIAEWKGRLAIIDFKTSRRVKEKKDILNYFMQATCYAMMLKERINIDARDIVILMMVDHSEAIVFEEKTQNYLRETLNFFQNYNDPLKLIQKEQDLESVHQKKRVSN
jgi:hypothetical protein